METMKIALTALLLILGIAHPPHAERQAGASLPPAVAGADHPGEVIAAYDEFIGGLEDVTPQVASTGRSTVSTPPGDGACEALSSELGISAAILWRESHCTWVDNPTGCGGRGCRGPAQLDAGHFRDVSPWNPSVPGSCADLDPDDPGQYAECVSRMPPSAWG